ncbi:MAG: XdhC family protein [Flavobacteriaceae bacterium]|nr:XdhC family protein [Flavobacteriaceae bacterium]
MTHEFKEIVEQAIENQQRGLKSVLATVVHLEGSSYRKPGVRMLINETGTMTGAVSGGCVEKEVVRRAQSVFTDGKTKVMAYDGRYRLGCEGTLYILIEPFAVSDNLLQAFHENLVLRNSFEIDSFYKKGDEIFGDFGSVVKFKSGDSFDFGGKPDKKLEVFSQELQPLFRLLIIGGEHDAVELCKMASLLGWQVDVITSMNDPKQLSDFPGAHSVIGQSPETIDFNGLTENMAIVIMNHSYVQDLRYVVKLSRHTVRYIGILGAAKRRERLFNELFDFAPDVSEEFLESIYTPAGLNIGAETPEEIALSILAEIHVVLKEKEPFSLRKITGKINV